MNKQPMIWVDVETTGLDFKEDRVLEVGAFACDDDFVVLDRYHGVAHLDEESLGRLSKAMPALEMHAKSGLLVDAVHSNFKEWFVVDGFLNWLIQQVEVNYDNPDSRPRLWGSSVHFDLNMLRGAEVRNHKNSTVVDNHLHYRVMDVSSIAGLFERYIPDVFEKRPPDRKVHRVFEDLEDSIVQYQYYMQNLDLLYPHVSHA